MHPRLSSAATVVRGGHTPSAVLLLGDTDASAAGSLKRSAVYPALGVRCVFQRTSDSQKGERIGGTQSHHCRLLLLSLGQSRVMGCCSRLEGRALTVQGGVQAKIAGSLTGGPAMYTHHAMQFANLPPTYLCD